MPNKGSLGPLGFQDQRGYPTREMDTAEETGPLKREEVTPRTDTRAKSHSQKMSHPLGRGPPCPVAPPTPRSGKMKIRRPF